MSAAHGEPAAAPAVGAFQRKMIMATCMLAASIYSMNLTIVSISLPNMQGTFSASPDQIAWVVTGFILGLTMTVACIGWVSERLGRKRVYVAALAAFVATSVMCGNATILEEELLWRFLQGVTGAAILPISQSIILDVYPRAEHGRALALWGLGNMAGPIIAPPIGGIITEAYGWQSVFDINLPFGLLALLGTILFVPSTPSQKRPLDMIGLIALVGGVGLVQLAVNRGARLDWFESSEILFEIAGGILLLYLFVIRILTARRPFLDPIMFRDRNYWVGLIVISAFGAFSFLPVVTLPLFMRNLLDYPIEIVGLLLVPRALGVVCGNLFVGRAMSRTDPRYLITLGLLFVVYSSWEVTTWTLDTGVWEIAANGVFQGLGNGMIWVTVNTMTFSNLEPRQRAQAVPLYFLTFNLAASIGIAAFVTYWVRASRSTAEVLSEQFSATGSAVRQGIVPRDWDLSDPSTAAAIQDLIDRQASMIGYELSFQLVALAALLLIPLAFLFRKPG
ncbi:MAG: DHA2 family efflux MFS transporter permease subunit [Proteobacteria bacterium]|nr:DHA2 family efflux MFS transporter permease subunit [Pseudomonadota bacterium]